MLELGSWGGLTLAIRGTGDALHLEPAERRAIQDVDPTLPVLAITVAAHVDASLRQERLFAGLTTLFGALALSVNTARPGHQNPDGARCGALNVVWLMLRDSLAVVVLGVAIGLALALAEARWIQSLLFGPTPTDLE